MQEVLSKAKLAKLTQDILPILPHTLQWFRNAKFGLDFQQLGSRLGCHC